MPFKLPSHASARLGFSMIELLLVMTVMAVLAAATIPALRGSLDSINLSGAGEFTQGQLSMARQIALSRNLPVEVRIYQDTSLSTKPWHIIGLVISGTVMSTSYPDEWISAPASLPGNIIFDTSQDGFSSIIKPTFTLSGTSAPRSDRETNPSAPRKVRGMPYVAFSFLANGTTNLPLGPTGNSYAWDLSLKNPNDQPSGTAPAHNYVALVLDPLTGRTLSYLPTVGKH